MISPREQLILLAKWESIRRQQIAEAEAKDREEREVRR